MTSSTRMSGSLQRADTREPRLVARLDTYSEHPSILLGGDQVSIQPNTHFDVQGLTTIRELLIDADGYAVSVELGNGSDPVLVIPITGVVYMQHVTLTHVRVINASSTVTAVVNVFAGGS